MNRIARDGKFVPYGILHYYSSGQTSDEALARLLRSHEKNPELFPRVDGRDVEFWYNSFKNNNYDMDQEPTYPGLAQLLKLPVLDQVIHDLSASDQKSLHNVCTSLRSFVKEENRVFDKVILRMNKKSIMFQAKHATSSDDIQVLFRQKKEGCKFTQNNTTESSEMDFIQAAMQKFQETIEKVHTKVKEFNIDLDRLCNRRTYKKLQKDFLSKLISTLRGMKEKLDIQHLEICVRKPRELDAILGRIKSRSLKELKIFVVSRSPEEFKLSKVSKLSQHLPHLEHFTASGDLKINEIAHIPFVFYNLSGMLTAEELAAHKNTLLESPDFKVHVIYKAVSLGSRRWPIRELKTALKPFAPIGDGFESEVKGAIPYADGSGHKLMFELTKFHIEFTKEKDRR